MYLIFPINCNYKLQYANSFEQLVWKKYKAGNEGFQVNMKLFCFNNNLSYIVIRLYIPEILHCPLLHNFN